MKTIYSGRLLVLNLKVLHTSPAVSLSVMGAIAALPNAHCFITGLLFQSLLDAGTSSIQNKWSGHTDKNRLAGLATALL